MWEYILENWKVDVENIDLLIAPHHGRDSGRSYDFLDVLKPTLTLFGNARSEHLAYDAWNNRGLWHITNNQANCVIIDINTSSADVFATYETFAKAFNTNTSYNNQLRAWFLDSI